MIIRINIVIGTYSSSQNHLTVKCLNAGSMFYAVTLSCSIVRGIHLRYTGSIHHGMEVVCIMINKISIAV